MENNDYFEEPIKTRLNIQTTYSITILYRDGGVVKVVNYNNKDDYKKEKKAVKKLLKKPKYAFTEVVFNKRVKLLRRCNCSKLNEK
jgi:hypothetical protein